MRKIIVGMSTLALALLGAGPALAAPFNATNNPQIVANYSSGDHGVPGEPYLHQGSDVVMRAGNSGNFQQWFYGTTTEPGVTTEGDHSVWKLSDNGTCPNGWFKMTVNSSNFWGDYLVNGGTYCIRTNDFHSSENHDI